MSSMRSATAVASSPGSIRYEPSPTMANTVAVGRGELDPHRARQLVAHARIAVLDVIALTVGVRRPPQLVQVAGHRAGRADDDVALPAASFTAPITSAWLGSGPWPAA